MRSILLECCIMPKSYFLCFDLLRIYFIFIWNENNVISHYCSFLNSICFDVQLHISVWTNIQNIFNLRKAGKTLLDRVLDNISDSEEEEENAPEEDTIGGNKFSFIELQQGWRFSGILVTQTSYFTRDIFMSFWNMTIIICANERWDVGTEDAKAFYSVTSFYLHLFKKILVFCMLEFDFYWIFYVIKIVKSFFTPKYELSAFFCINNYYHILKPHENRYTGLLNNPPPPKFFWP